MADELRKAIKPTAREMTVLALGGGTLVACVYFWAKFCANTFHNAAAGALISVIPIFILILVSTFTDNYQQQKRISRERDND